jgi:hypothetical protein
MSGRSQSGILPRADVCEMPADVGAVPRLDIADALNRLRSKVSRRRIGLQDGAGNGSCCLFDDDASERRCFSPVVAEDLAEHGRRI